MLIVIQMLMWMLMLLLMQFVSQLHLTNDTIIATTISTDRQQQQQHQHHMTNTGEHTQRFHVVVSCCFNTLADWLTDWLTEWMNDMFVRMYSVMAGYLNIKRTDVSLSPTLFITLSLFLSLAYVVDVHHVLYVGNFHKMSFVFSFFLCFQNKTNWKCKNEWTKTAIATAITTTTTTTATATAIANWINLHQVLSKSI